MKNLAIAGRALLLDFASTILFLALYALTGNIAISVIAGIVLALGQLGWKLLRREKPDALQWISLVLVIGSGSATLVVHNPIFVMLKPTIINLLIAGAMLQKGWMVRYMPARAMEFVPDLVVTFGYVWAGLMALTAILNLVLAFNFSVMVWSSIMSVWGIARTVALVLAQYGIMKTIGRQRHDARNGMRTGTAAA
ncbi:MAG TPA: septation protein IspZ [Rhizomicrobium sp.]|jgi:intracellular septation protein A|nr:septation protein IspZ [Rhizomicrobium sp.]